MVSRKLCSCKGTYHTVTLRTALVGYSAGGCPRTQLAQHSSPTQCYVPQSEPTAALMHQQAVHAAPDPAIPAAMPLLQAHVGIAALAAQQHTPFCITLLPAQILLVTMGAGPPSSLPHKPCFPWNPNSGIPTTPRCPLDPNTPHLRRVCCALPESPCATMPILKNPKCDAVPRKTYSLNPKRPHSSALT